MLDMISNLTCWGQSAMLGPSWYMCCLLVGTTHLRLGTTRKHKQPIQACLLI